MTGKTKTNIDVAEAVLQVFWNCGCYFPSVCLAKAGTRSCNRQWTNVIPRHPGRKRCTLTLRRSDEDFVLTNELLPVSRQQTV